MGCGDGLRQWVGAMGCGDGLQIAVAMVVAISGGGHRVVVVVV